MLAFQHAYGMWERNSLVKHGGQRFDIVVVGVSHSFRVLQVYQQFNGVFD